jgi:hypothetical protein
MCRTGVIGVANPPSRSIVNGISLKAATKVEAAFWLQACTSERRSRNRKWEGKEDMATFSIVQLRKKGRKVRSCLPDCRSVFSLLVLASLAQAWQAAPPPVAGCQAAGQIFGWDLLGHTLTLKSDSGEYSNFRYDGSTKFTKDETPVSQEDLNINDRVCVVAFRAGTPEIASRVRVTPRSEIEGRDKQELVRWQSESLFGTVKSLDAGNRRITLSVTGSADVSVNAADAVPFWILPPAADDPAQAVHGGWESLAPGDAIYVRGERAAGVQDMRARLIVLGGFRSLTGSVESMEPLTGLVHIRDFRSGPSRAVHFDFMSIYAVGMNAAAGARDRHLYPATIGDLKEGDSVLILGREDYQTGNTEALLLITGFTRGGFLEPGPGQSVDWIFQAIGFRGRKEPGSGEEQPAHREQQR